MAEIGGRKRLRDIKDSIDAINGFLCRCHRRFDAFCVDDMFRAAVLYHIAIIGEAVNNILKIDPEITISSARKIVKARSPEF